MEASVRGPVAYPELITPPEERIPDSFWVSLRYFNLYRIVLAVVFLGTAIFYDDAINLGTHSLELFRYIAAGYSHSVRMIDGHRNRTGARHA